MSFTPYIATSNYAEKKRIKHLDFLFILRAGCWHRVTTGCLRILCTAYIFLCLFRRHCAWFSRGGGAFGGEAEHDSRVELQFSPACKSNNSQWTPCEEKEGRHTRYIEKNKDIDMLDKQPDLEEECVWDVCEYGRENGDGLTHSARVITAKA